ncbi:NUDIX hydrolase [Nocardia takedensis]|uniref:NUDIX hydrolase n=1 Tax=Nocardia takedensis TaxID=259390 RepID=UPI000300A08E|nr:NUDIX domain-containing protein [Nocardia takedensis]
MRPEQLAGIEHELRAAARAEGIGDFVVGVAVFRDSKLLVVRRVPNDFHGGLYELPGGGVESGESFVECVGRELFEETGLRVRYITKFLGAIDYATRSKARVRKFSFLAEADAGSIALDPGEHDAYAWIDPAEHDLLPMSPDTRQIIGSLIATADSHRPA